MPSLHFSLRCTAPAALLVCVSAAGFRVPGANYPAQVREEISILPGGRVLRPYGHQVLTGTAPFALAISPSGKTIVTANIGLSKSIGLDRASITVMVPGKHGSAWTLADYHAEARHSDPKAWQGVTAGLAVISDNSVWISEGDTGRVMEVNLSTGYRKAAVNLNTDGYGSSFADALIYDSARNLLVVLDQANSRVAIIDSKRLVVVASAKTGVLPVAQALSPDGKRLYVANTGGTPSLSIIDLSDPTTPKMQAEVALGENGSAPSGVAVHGDDVYISLSNDDAIAIVDGKTGRVEGSIPLRIPHLEAYRGITPIGLAFDPKAGRLLVAEAGINAVGVIDPASRKLLGHLPVAWFPVALSVAGGQVYVVSARGVGTGPSSPAHRIRMVGGGRQGSFSFDLEASALRRGCLSAFAVPDENELTEQTRIVMQNNGFTPAAATPERKVPPVRYVVLIVKGDRTFDEILGDVSSTGDRMVLGEPSFARFGLDGYVSGGRIRFSLHTDVTPNHHAIAGRWSFSDNFYVDSDYSSANQRWLAGICPDFWSETEPLYQEAGIRKFATAPSMPQSGTLWSHLERHQVDFRNFDENDAQVSDQSRASHFIDAVRRDYLEPGKPLPRFLEIHLPNDTAAPPHPDDGYDYEASYVADNDYALGRVVDFLSHSPWWKEMAVFVTESGAEYGADHVDSHRTVLLGAGPWFRADYVSHTNTSFPALLATIYKLLDVPPLNLYDAAAGDLLDMFGTTADLTPYDVKAEDLRLFDPQMVKE